MLVQEKLYTRSSPNGLQYSDKFSATLMRALPYQRLLVLSKYDTAVEKYVTPVRKVERRAPTRYNNYDDVDSDDLTPPRKRGKKEDNNVDYMERFYCFILGMKVNENDSGPLQWIQRDKMYTLFNKLKGSCRFVTEVQDIRAKWDLNLRKNRSDVYLMVPNKPMIITYAFVKKFQAADWSTEEAGAEAPSKICVGAFTPSTTEQRRTTSQQVHDVEMDGWLKQSDNHRSAIGKDVCINYKINSIHDAIRTLAAILAFLTNLTDWEPAQSPRQKEQPKLVDFMEQVIC